MFRNAMVGLAAVIVAGVCGCDYRPGVRVIDERRTEMDVGRDELVFPRERPTYPANPPSKPYKPVYRQD